MNKINLSPEQKATLEAEIITFFDKERDETIGKLAARQVLDFFIEKLGDQYYNIALDAAKVWFSRRMEDLEGDYETLYR